MTTYRTVLVPERQSLIPGLGCSVVMHGGVLVVTLLASALLSYCGARRPVIDLDQTMEVSMVVLPKSATKVPDRAARAPVPKGTDAPPTPEAPPPPPVQSDLAFKTEKAQEHEGTDQDREQLLEEMRRQEMLKNLLNAPTGPVDREATDPNSDSDLSINAAGAGSRGDPEFAAYIAKVQQLFMQHFKPLGAITAGKPDLVCKVFVTVDPRNGTVTSWEIQTSSGIPAYDAAAERAVAEVGQIPLPPERFMALVAQGYTVNFRPP